jgi:hypothetical protein
MAKIGFLDFLVTAAWAAISQKPSCKTILNTDTPGFRRRTSVYENCPSHVPSFRPSAVKLNNFNCADIALPPVPGFYPINHGSAEVQNRGK